MTLKIDAAHHHHDAALPLRLNSKRYPEQYYCSMAATNSKSHDELVLLARKLLDE